jgi:hypothetical protein
VQRQFIDDSNFLEKKNPPTYIEYRKKERKKERKIEVHVDDKTVCTEEL